MDELLKWLQQALVLKMVQGRFSDLYNPHWGRNVENASFLLDGCVGEVVGNNVGNRKIRVLFAIRCKSFFFSMAIITVTVTESVI